MPPLAPPPTFAQDRPVYVIAEAGSNWRMGTAARDRQAAFALIDVAVESGCDAVKFQTFRPDHLYAPNAGQSDYLAASGHVEDIHKILADLVMPYELLGELAKYANDKGLHFMSSAFSVPDLQAVDPHVPAHKIASYELNHVRLLEYVASTGKPVVVSTGAAELPEIGAALEILRARTRAPLCVLQCTAKYPAPTSALNLKVLPLIAERFNVAVGLSDHSVDPLVGPMAAVALGAKCLEKHYTLSKKLPGPDHAFAIEPDELLAMVRGVRAVEQSLGSGAKVVQDDEKELRAYAVRALQATKPIARGDVLVEGGNFDILRPGKNRAGATPLAVNDANGKRATRDITLGDGVRAGDWG